MVHERDSRARSLSPRFALILAMAATACGTTARLPVTAGMGPQPALPRPSKSLIPLVHVVTAKGWPAGATPVAASGTSVVAFAQGLDHPRWVYLLPNGDVLVAETNAPPRPEDAKGIKGWFFKGYQKKAGGAVPSANRITFLRDADGDGVAEVRSSSTTTTATSATARRACSSRSASTTRRTSCRTSSAPRLPRPHVAGVAALMLDKNARLSPGRV
jgi:glucose/arabinose dehydrogenase